MRLQTSARSVLSRTCAYAQVHSCVTDACCLSLPVVYSVLLIPRCLVSSSAQCCSVGHACTRGSSPIKGITHFHMMVPMQFLGGVQQELEHQRQLMDAIQQMQQ